MVNNLILDKCRRKCDASSEGKFKTRIRQFGRTVASKGGVQLTRGNRCEKNGAKKHSVGKSALRERRVCKGCFKKATDGCQRVTCTCDRHGSTR